MEDINVSRFLLSVGDCTIDHTPAKESFQGFTQKEVRNCAEKILKLTDFEPSLPDAKPLAQIEYKDISNSLEQKLLNFYLYKKNRNQNTFTRKSQMVISTEEHYSISLENFSYRDGGKVRKRKSPSGCFQGDVLDETLAIKKRKLNCGVNNERVTNHSHLMNDSHVAERFIMKTGNSLFEACSVLSCAPVPPIKNSLLYSTSFSVVRQWQNPLNIASATNHKDLMSGSLSSIPKSINLRKSKLSLRNDDLEKLKENLIETLKDDMKEDQVGHLTNSHVDDKLRNLSKLIKNSNFSESKCIGGEALSSTFFEELDRIDMRRIQNTAQEAVGARVLKESEKPTDTMFESLSEKILYEVRKLMASSQQYPSDVRKSSTLSEMVKNDGFISLPESGTAIITSSCLLDICVCFACGSAGRLPEDKLLFCNECCEPFHKYCLGFRITEANKSSWLCKRCQKNVYMGMGMTADAVVRELVEILNDKNCHDDSSDSKFKYKRRCALCFKAGDLPSNLGGRLLYVGSNHWVHVNCILWSEGVRELRNGQLVNVRQTISDSKFKQCSHCNRPGASIKCSVRQCLKRFHFSCAVAGHCSFGKNIHFHCPKHASVLHRNNITSIFCVKRKIFAADPEESSNLDFFKKSISIGNFKLISLRNSSRSQNGYRSRRRFWSTKDPRKLCTYFCSIFEMKHTVSEVCMKTGTISKILFNETEKKTVRENLRRHLMELKRIKMVENRKHFPKLAQLDGTAGIDSDEDNDDTMNFEDFSNSTSHNNTQQSNANPVTSSGNPIISFQDISSFSTPLKSNIKVSSNSHHVIVTTNLSYTPPTYGRGCSKLDTPNKSFKISATPVQQYRGQISYLGSVVATNFQSLLKPKQSSMNSNQFPKACSDAAHSSNHQEPLKSTQSSFYTSTNGIQHSNMLSNVTTFRNSCITNPALNAVLSSPLQSKQSSSTAAETTPVNSSRLLSPLKPMTSAKSAETNAITSGNIGMKTQVQFLGSIPSANLQAFLKSKIGKSPPLNNNISFPNLPLMDPLNVQNTGSHSDLNPANLRSSDNNISQSVSSFTTAHSHVSLQATALNTEVMPSAKITCSNNVQNRQCPELITNNLTYVNSNILTNSLETSKHIVQNVSETNSNLITPRSILGNDRSLTKMATESLFCPVNQPVAATSPTTELVEAAASRVITSMDTEMVSSSSPSRFAILKPAAGFDKPRPFTSNELMFTDSEEEDQDGIINSRVFSDFDDFVRNFETRTNMPILKLRRCDHMIAPSLASPSFKTKAFSASSESISSSHLNNLSVSSNISTILSVVDAESIMTRNMSSEPLNSVRILTPTKTSCLTNKLPSVSATKISSTLFTPTCISSGVQNPPSSLVLSTQPSPFIHANNMLPSSSVQNLKSTFPSSNISSLLGLAVTSPLAATEVTSFSSSSLSSHKFTTSESRNSSNNCTPPVSFINLQSCNGSLKPPATVSVNSKQVVQAGLSSLTTKLSNDVDGNEICDKSNYSKSIEHGVINNNSRSYSKEGNNNPAPGEKMLVFEIKSSDGFSCSGSSAEEAWSKMKTELDSSRRKLSLRPISLGGMRGLTFFGLDHPVVINLIHNCADKGSSGVSRKGSVDLVEVKEGCARFVPFSQRKPLDVFHFLLSEHRRTIKVSEPVDDDEFDRNRSALASADLPLSGRYKKMRSLSSVSVSVRRSRIHGRGLFAMHDIDNGEMVIEYCGQVIRSVLTDSREKMYESKGIGCYMFKVDDSRVVDATMRGNAARFINHSCDPNCTSKIIHVDGRKHIVICATRFIRKGEELTYNYKFPIEEGNKIPCCCGSRKCKKFMN